MRSHIYGSTATIYNYIYQYSNSGQNSSAVEDLLRWEAHKFVRKYTVQHSSRPMLTCPLLMVQTGQSKTHSQQPFMTIGRRTGGNRQDGCEQKGNPCPNKAQAAC